MVLKFLETWKIQIPQKQKEEDLLQGFLQHVRVNFMKINQ